MKTITFFDTEVDPQYKKVLDIGGVKSNGAKFHSKSFSDFKLFFNDSDFICGHNVLHHDLKYLGNESAFFYDFDHHVIDTLYLSPLLFPTKPSHRLLKDDNIVSDELNNPVRNRSV